MAYKEFAALLQLILENKETIRKLNPKDMYDVLIIITNGALKQSKLLEKAEACIKETMPLLDNYEKYLDSCSQALEE